MKNISLILFISFLCLITYTNSKATFTTRKAKKQNSQSIQFVNEGYVKSQDIATYGNHTWVCTPQNTFFKLGGLNTTVSGNAPTDCTRLSTNRNGDLYVVSKENKLFVLRRISDASHVWSLITDKVKVHDVSVGPNGEVAIINDKGVIYEVKSDIVASDPFNKEKFGADCKIAVSFEKELVVFVANSSKEVFRVTTGSKARLFPSVLADDLDVSANFNLYVTSKTGVYRKLPRSNDLYLIRPDGIADNISVGSKIWVIGYDGFPYSAVDSV